MMETLCPNADSEALSGAANPGCSRFSGGSLRPADASVSVARFGRSIYAARPQKPAKLSITLSLLTACLILTSGCSKKEAPEEAEAPAPVQVAAVTQDTVRKSVTADGTPFPVD